MNTQLSRLFLAGGQNAVPLPGWFLGGEYWHRTQRAATQNFARDEEVMERA
jgi:hypothetical protein